MPESQPTRTHAYVGFDPCGHATLAVVDDPSHQRDTFREVNLAVRRGARIERMTIDEARAALKAWNFDKSSPCKHVDVAEAQP